MKSTLSLQPSASSIPRDQYAGLAWAVVSLWLAATACAFWSFELKDFRAFGTSSTQIFMAGERPLLEEWYRSVVAADGSEKLTLVHVFREGCRCNAYAETELARLKGLYRARGVRFLAASLPSSPSVISPPLDTGWATPARHLPDNVGIHVGPAALIFGPGGRLMYYGPYSDSAWCGGSGELLDRALDEALQGRMPRTGSAARGCFCTG